MGGQEEVPVDQEPSAGTADLGHRRRFSGKNRSFHPLRLAHTFAEAEGLAQNPHFPSSSSTSTSSWTFLGLSAKALDLLIGSALRFLQMCNAQKLLSLPPDVENA